MSLKEIGGREKGKTSGGKGLMVRGKKCFAQAKKLLGATAGSKTPMKGRKETRTTRMSKKKNLSSLPRSGRTLEILQNLRWNDEREGLVAGGARRGGVWKKPSG